MKDGELTCLGDTPHLRATHRTGYIIELTLSSDATRQAAVDFVLSNFPNSAVLSDRFNCLKISIPKSSITSLSTAFAVIERDKQEVNIVEYSLCQTSLEEVFISKIQPRVMDDDVELDDGRIKATQADFIAAYTMWFLSAFAPGLYRFFLRDYKNGILYFLSANMLMLGWYQDFW
jgi:hypothetical protein